jgi:hypothetical protein
MSSFMHDARGNPFRKRRFSDDEFGIELTSVQ